MPASVAASIAPSPALSPCRRVIFASPVASCAQQGAARPALPACVRAQGRGTRVSTIFYWARSIRGRRVRAVRTFAASSPFTAPSARAASATAPAASSAT